MGDMDHGFRDDEYVARSTRGNSHSAPVGGEKSVPAGGGEGGLMGGI